MAANIRVLLMPLLLPSPAQMMETRMKFRYHLPEIFFCHSTEEPPVVTEAQALRLRKRIVRRRQLPQRAG